MERMPKVSGQIQRKVRWLEQRKWKVGNDGLLRLTGDHTCPGGEAVPEANDQEGERVWCGSSAQQGWGWGRTEL